MWHSPRPWFNPCSCTFFILYNSNKGKYWNPLESVGIPWNMGIPMDSNRFQWNPFLEAPGFQMILVNSIGFHWKFHGMENQNGWGSSQMDSVGIPWNSEILVRIWQILPELMGESKDLQSPVLVMWLLQPTTPTPTTLLTNLTHCPMTTHIHLATRSPPFTVVSKPLVSRTDNNHHDHVKKTRKTCKRRVNMQMTRQCANNTTTHKQHNPPQMTTRTCISHQWPPPAMTGHAQPANVTPPPSTTSNAN